VYLAATSKQGFPSLAKVLVAMNRSTALADSVSLAFAALQEKLQPRGAEQ
jgi:uncharacterized membrane protein (UPF0182 family)